MARTVAGVHTLQFNKQKNSKHKICFINDICNRSINNINWSVFCMQKTNLLEFLMFIEYLKFYKENIK